MGFRIWDSVHRVGGSGPEEVGACARTPLFGANVWYTCICKSVLAFYIVKKYHAVLQKTL